MSYFKDKFRAIFSVKDTPHRIALAFAIGVFMGISPFLGLHYIGGIFLAWLLRLNRLVAIVGVSVNNPWSIVPISSFSVWVGAKIMRINQVLPDVDWGNVGLIDIIKKMADFDNFLYGLKQLMPLIKSFFVGSFVICTLSAVISYFVIEVTVRRYNKIKDAA